MSPKPVSLLHEVRTFIRTHHLMDEGANVVVGVSGGADSIALLHILTELGYAAIAVHVNYGLRGRESDQDENFVRRFCARFDVPLLVHRIDLKRDEPEESVQVAARRIRYDQFLRAARTHDADIVAVAHHADDQAETLLLNLFRGTGPEGLAGMPVRRELRDGISLVRPMLEARRSQIESYLIDSDLEWREDLSNREVVYRRGFIRNRLLPLVKQEYGSHVVDRIVQTAKLMRGYVESSLRPDLEIRFERCRGMEDRTLDASALRNEPPVWRQRILLEGLDRWLPNAPRSHATADRLAGLLSSQPGSRIITGSGTVWREHDKIRFTADTHCELERRTLVPGTRLSFAHGAFLLEEVDRGSIHFDRDDRFTEFIDLDALEPPVEVRLWKDGDRLRPLGLGGSRLVSDILTDARVPSSRRRDIPVVTDANGIIWLVGHRIDERVSITDGTTRVACISFDSPAK